MNSHVRIKVLEIIYKIGWRLPRLKEKLAVSERRMLVDPPKALVLDQTVFQSELDWILGICRTLEVNGEVAAVDIGSIFGSDSELGIMVSISIIRIECKAKYTMPLASCCSSRASSRHSRLSCPLCHSIASHGCSGNDLLDSRSTVNLT